MAPERGEILFPFVWYALSLKQEEIMERLAARKRMGSHIRRNGWEVDGAQNKDYIATANLFPFSFLLFFCLPTYITTTGFGQRGILAMGKDMGPTCVGSDVALQWCTYHSFLSPFLISFGCNRVSYIIMRILIVISWSWPIHAINFGWCSRRRHASIIKVVATEVLIYVKWMKSLLVKALPKDISCVTMVKVSWYSKM